MFWLMAVQGRRQCWGVLGLDGAGPRCFPLAEGRFVVGALLREAHLQRSLSAGSSSLYSLYQPLVPPKSQNSAAPASFSSLKSSSLAFPLNLPAYTQLGSSASPSHAYLTHSAQAFASSAHCQAANLVS